MYVQRRTIVTVSMAIQITITVFTRLYRLKKSKRLFCVNRYFMTIIVLVQMTASAPHGA